MLKVIVLIALAAMVNGFQPKASPVFNYHEEIGIPNAVRIKAAEDVLLTSRSNPLEGLTEDDDSRIVGGVIAPITSHPYLAGLVVSFTHTTGRSVCGSSIITANRLLTAAHCWFDGVNQAWQFEAVFGSQLLFSGGLRIATSQVVSHPQWTPSLLRNDVAMVYLPTNIAFNQLIQPIALPSGSQLWQDFTGMWSVAAGYGVTSDSQNGVSTSTQLSQVWLQVITVTQCQAVFGATFVQASNICTNGAGGVGICGGDSGGPLVVNQNGQDILVGVSSFVARDACQQGFPSAFARVTSFINFIQQHLF